jgi:hypothetical protein
MYITQSGKSFNAEMVHCPVQVMNRNPMLAQFEFDFANRCHLLRS